MFVLTTSSIAAEDIKPAIKSAMTVYTHIVETEAIIDICRRIDFADAVSYEKIYKRYQDETRNIVMRIGFLVGQEFRRAGVDKESLWKGLDTLIEKAVETGEQMARKDPNRFALECKGLPNAIIEKSRLFEPLGMRFPHEMKILQSRL